MKIRIKTTKHFDRQYEKLHKKKPQIKSLLLNSCRLLKHGSLQSNSLKVHKLKGELKDRYAFSLTYDLRVTFKRIENVILLLNIGSHNEVY